MLAVVVQNMCMSQIWKIWHRVRRRHSHIQIPTTEFTDRGKIPFVLYFPQAFTARSAQIFVDAVLKIYIMNFLIIDKNQ